MLIFAESVPWYINPVLLPALSGLLGVIVGALITAVSTYVIERRREIREQDKESRERAITLTTAARLIGLEFHNAQLFANVCAENKRWTSLFKEPPSLSHWHKYSASVAAELHQEDWLRLVSGAQAATILQNHFLRACERNKREITDDMSSHLTSHVIPPLERAQEVLQKLTAST